MRLKGFSMSRYPAWVLWMLSIEASVLVREHCLQLIEVQRTRLEKQSYMRQAVCKVFTRCIAIAFKPKP